MSKLTPSEQAEIEAVKTGCISFIIAVVGVIILCAVVMYWQSNPTYSEQDLEDARVVSYEAGYQQGSRNCVSAYTEAWGE